MTIGIPRSLLYHKYHAFFETFLEELGAELSVSPETNKWILDEGVRCCVDDACLPIKVFHGHVSWLKDRCDAILAPHFIGIRKREYICPMFCGLADLVSNDIQNLPVLIDAPIYSLEGRALSVWAQKAGGMITGDKSRISRALREAQNRQSQLKTGFCDEGYELKAGLIGHAYNINDSFVNMDLKNKLNRLGVGVITSEFIDRQAIDSEAGKLFKRPFWSFAREYYGAAVTICRERKADGIVYISSFSCGVDSVVTELIKCEIGNFPFMVLKLDEHTGEAGLDTRIEAFADMLRRRCRVGHYIS